MEHIVLKAYVTIQGAIEDFARDESGQDLIEYALIVALIALAATASMKTLATAIGAAFGSVGTKLGTYTS